MDPLQAAVAAAVMLTRDNIPFGVPLRASPLVRLGKSVHALIRDARTLDKTDPLQFGQVGQSCDRLVCQMRTAAQIDVPNSIALLD